MLIYCKCFSFYFSFLYFNLCTNDLPLFTVPLAAPTAEPSTSRKGYKPRRRLIYQSSSSDEEAKMVEKGIVTEPPSTYDDFKKSFDAQRKRSRVRKTLLIMNSRGFKVTWRYIYLHKWWIVDRGNDIKRD